MSDGWDRDELHASVEAYLEMQRKFRAGEKFTKKQYYQDLASRFKRTGKAFEYRMQNISYVMTLIGREWLPGLKPAKNVGAKVASEIEELIGILEGNTLPRVAGFEVEVREQLRLSHLPIPAGVNKPGSASIHTTQYQRDPSVKAWVLKTAAGICECCSRAAPFQAADGTPFLEVHHVRQLAEGGSDTTTNTVALCPNCHRELHYGENARQLGERLYQLLPRLIRE